MLHVLDLLHALCIIVSCFGHFPDLETKCITKDTSCLKNTHSKQEEDDDLRPSTNVRLARVLTCERSCILSIARHTSELITVHFNAVF
jgi:hypothetical protein